MLIATKPTENIKKTKTDYIYRQRNRHKLLRQRKQAWLAHYKVAQFRQIFIQEYIYVWKKCWSRSNSVKSNCGDPIYVN